jgi:hypothetical protein
MMNWNPLRSLPRPHRALLGACTAAALLGGGAVWYSWANAEPTVVVPTPATPSPNARDAYLRAVALLVDDKAVADAIETPKRRQERGQHVYTWAEKEALLTANAPVLHTLREGFAHPFYNPPIYSWDVTSPEYAKFRAAARLLRLESDVRALRGDYAGAADSGLDAIRLGTEVPRGGVLIPGLVGLACEAIGRRPLWGLMDRLATETASANARRLEEMEARRPLYADTLREEKWATQRVLLKMFRGRSTLQVARELAEGVRDVSEREKMRCELMVAIVPYSKRQIIANHAAYMDAGIAAARLPYQAAVARTSQPEPKDPVNRLLTPVFTQARFKFETARMENGLLTAALALRAYQVRNDAYPVSLDALVRDGILTRVPSDPFSQDGAAPVRYARTDGGGFRLYSVGPDGKDDGGRAVEARRRPNGEPRRWPEATDNGDWVVGTNTAVE